METNSIVILQSDFIKEGIRLYHTMQNEIRLHGIKDIGAEELIQGSFEIANDYKIKLAESLSVHTFRSLAEEIFYFKELQPLFTAEAEYHTYCYHVELFRSAMVDNNPVELALFLRRQLLRMEKFARENREIYDYLTSGRTDMDEEWFTRIDEEGASIYDKQAGSYKAIERFETFMKKDLLQTGMVKPKNDANPLRSSGL